MALKEHQLWDLFDRVWRDYTAAAARLCNDIALRQVDDQEVPNRLAAIQRDPRIDKAGKAFMWLGKAYIERTKPELLMNKRRDNLLHQALDVTDDFVEELGHVIDQPGTRTVQDVASKCQPMFGDIHVQDIKKEIELAWKLASQEQRSGAKNTTVPTQRKDGKKNTIPGDAAEKILSALCKHHNYDHPERCNLAPAQFTDIASSAGTSKGSVTNFFSRQLEMGPNEQPRHAYRRICNNGTIIERLRIWRGEALRTH